MNRFSPWPHASSCGRFHFCMRHAYTKSSPLGSFLQVKPRYFSSSPSIFDILVGHDLPQPVHVPPSPGLHVECGPQSH